MADQNKAVRIIATALAVWEHDGDGDLEVTTLHVMRARHLLALLADSAKPVVHVHVQPQPEPSFGAGLAAGYEEGRRHGRR